MGIWQLFDGFFTRRPEGQPDLKPYPSGESSGVEEGSFVQRDQIRSAIMIISNGVERCASVEEIRSELIGAIPFDPMSSDPSIKMEYGAYKLSMLIGSEIDIVCSHDPIKVLAYVHEYKECIRDEKVDDLLSRCDPAEALDFAASRGMNKSVHGLLGHVDCNYNPAIRSAVQNGHIDCANTIRQHAALKEQALLKSHVLDESEVHDQPQPRARRRM